MDFDPKIDAEEYNKLQETLFYKAFMSKDVEFCDVFNDIQQNFTSKYASGLVAPIILHGIPFYFISIGSKAPNVFSKDDKQIVATLTDCIAEYLRLNMIFTAVQKSRKVIVFGGDKEIQEIEELLDKNEPINIKRKEKKNENDGEP